jgi:ERCC4-type nuclease
MKHLIKPSILTVPKPSKSIAIPPGFALIFDTREQRPFFFRLPKDLPVIRTTLKAGDYSIKGFEKNIAIERKSLNDFLISIGKERERFKKELEILRGYEWAGLVIEASEKELFQPQIWSSMSPESIRGTLISIAVKYHVHIYYNQNREECEQYILKILTYFYKLKRKP